MALLIDPSDLDLYANNKVKEFVNKMLSELKPLQLDGVGTYRRAWRAGSNTRLNEVLNVIERLTNPLL